MTAPRKTARIVCALALVGVAGWAGAASAQGGALDPEIVAKVDQPATYPTFSQIPDLPKDVRSPAGWKAAVVDQRLAGRRLQRTAERFGPVPTDAEAWAAQAKADAAPPPPVTTPAAEDDAALIASLRARASAPSR
jgi:hypothetical protein